MNLRTPFARLGNFFVVRKDKESLAIVGGSEGYATYDDAEAQLRAAKGKTDGSTYLILQVVGEFRSAVQLVPVHPMEADAS